MIGADAEAIDKAEDRQKFREAMDKIGLESPRSRHRAYAWRRRWRRWSMSACPPSSGRASPWAGSGGGIAYNKADFIAIVTNGLDLSPTTEVLVEESAPRLEGI